MINRIKIFLISLFIAKPVLAQEEWSLQVNWPDSPLGNGLTAESGIAHLVRYFYEWSIVIGIILTFGILVYASVKYIISSGNPQKLNKAKNLLSSAFLGLLLLFSSWLLISILNPELARISKITPLNIPTEKDSTELELKTEKELCDYGIVSYVSRKYEALEKTILQEGESKVISMDPYKSIVCKEKEGFGRDIVETEEEAVKFIKARKVSGAKNPVCPTTLSENNSDCAEDIYESCEEEIFIPLEGNENMSKYCYDREFGESVLYISQKPDSNQTTCLAGDKIITDGGGCTLNLYEDQIAGGCAKMITSTNPVGGDVAESYDRNVECIEIIRNSSPVPEDLPNIDFVH